MLTNSEIKKYVSRTLVQIEQHKSKSKKYAICWVIEEIKNRERDIYNPLKKYLANKFEEYYGVDPLIQGGYWFHNNESITSHMSVAMWYKPRIEFLKRVLKDLEDENN